MKPQLIYIADFDPAEISRRCFLCPDPAVAYLTDGEDLGPISLCWECIDEGVDDMVRGVDDLGKDFIEEIQKLQADLRMLVKLRAFLTAPKNLVDVVEVIHPDQRQPPPPTIDGEAVPFR